MRLALFCGAVFAFIAFFAAPFARGADAEVARTWAKAKLTWPQEGRVESGEVSDSLDAAAKALAGRKAPAVVYLHGCSGLDRISSATAAFLAGAGYVVFSPDSFARTSKPASCNVASHASGLHRSVLGWRQAEAAYAVAEVRKLSFVDGARIYLYGFSEGAIVAATLEAVAVRARVIEGWSCHAGWPEYAGLHAPLGQPVLALTSVADPWFQAEWARGDCGDFIKGRFGSRAVVFRPPDPLSGEHYVSGNPAVQATILAFLRSR